MLLPVFLCCLGWLNFGSDQIMLWSKTFGHIKTRIRKSPPPRLLHHLWCTIWMFSPAKKTYFSIEGWNSPAYTLTVATRSVMSCRCDAPLASQVTMIFRRRIRLLTPGPNIRFGGVIILWKLAGWYHSTKTPLWGWLRIHTGADSQ